MNQQHRKVQHVKVRQDHAPSPRLTLHRMILVVRRDARHRVRVRREDVPRNASRERVRPGHDPIPKIIDVAGGTPPAGGDEAGAGLCLDGRQVGDARVGRVSAEAVLLVVGGAEDVVAGAEDGEDDGAAPGAEVDGVDGEVARLEGVDEGEPDEVTEGEHEAEAIGRDVDGGQDGWFHVEGV